MFTVYGSLFRRSKIISYQDLIVECVDKLFDKWRADSSERVHMNIVQQCQNLVLAIWGFIAFDYDLETLDDTNVLSKNELTRALLDLLRTAQTVLHSPTILSIIYLKLSPQYRRAEAIIRQYCNSIIEHELTQSSESIAQRKRTSLIASLVSSLQQDEKAKAMKNEEEKQGKNVRKKQKNLIKSLFFLSDRMDGNKV